MRVAIIGGGPSGLVQLKVLAEAHRHFPVEPIELKLFESHEKIGGIFFHHSYEDGEMVSSKFLTTFSDFRPRPDDADFLSSERYLEYLDQYASYFRLWPYIHLGTKVISVRRGPVSGHIVTYQTPDGSRIDWPCDAIAVCSGVHAIPNIPHIPGIENVPTVLHSQDFKTRAQLGKDKTVLILGSGETGADLAYISITADTQRVIMCHRDGWIGAPKRNPNATFFPWLFGPKDQTEGQIPVDVAQPTIFDSIYVHPMVRDSMLVWNYYHALALPVGSWVGAGSPHGIDQWVGQVYGERFHASRVFFNKAWQRIQNYVSAPWRPTEWPLSTRIRRFFYRADQPPPPRVIDVAPFPSHITPDGVAHFPRNSRPESERIQESVVKPDIVIFATGYLPAFPFFNTPDNQGQRPYPMAFDADVRQIWSSDDPTIGFIGFVRPGFGAIPPLSELQSMLFAMNLLNRIPRPLHKDDEWHYRIIHKPDARVTYGVEHDTYSYQLAKDIDGAPSFTEVLKLACVTPNGWRLPIVWGWGGNVNAKFRMRGPWRFEEAPNIMTGEMWEIITRRKGMFGNFNISFLPMLYLGSLSLFFFIYATLWDTLAALHLAEPLERRNEPKRIMEELEAAMTAEKEKARSRTSLHESSAKTNGTEVVNGAH
ncbi:hypothetical protein B0I35DRAFT_450094 [Stachybotrys elegans]|uniref:Dimethylaniline monooxygenase n=1 Tax=Stachybotrys elegans TaxID=80388 RepID=A0A8K0SUM1_9HYPO|nr:hypothetical protein B0I35DRAFT_450094 [Stachybotrys elegans]